jgi:hypothetical protein
MKSAIAAAIAIVIAIGGYIGYSKYEQHKFQESITPHVKNASIRLANAVRYETEKDTKISYKELFEKLESDVSEIDKRIIDVQTIAAPNNKEVTDPVLDYLKGGQELLRALLLKYRKHLALSSARDWADRTIDEIRSTRYYGREYALKSADKAIKDLEKAANEYDEATADVVSAARKMADVHSKVAPYIRSDALTDVAVFQAIVQKNEKKPKADSPKTEPK